MRIGPKHKRKTHIYSVDKLDKGVIHVPAARGKISSCVWEVYTVLNLWISAAGIFHGTALDCGSQPVTDNLENEIPDKGESLSPRERGLISARLP